ncbi:HNH endonuclease [Microbacterium sp. 179-I 3D4 NHS]|uniref:HNH endonuclease n=1 Tax=Microbacterium sp. 179-I 3D4 NHS TaxID=3142381 RepID=UPI0039A1AB0A
MRRTRLEQDSIRQDIFRWLDDRRDGGAYEYSRDELVNYTFNGERIPLLDTGRGIRNPSDFDSTLTIMTSSKKTRYSDGINSDGLVRYSYQSRDGGDNVKLRSAFEHADPLVYFLGVRPSHYVAFYPVYIVHDDPVARVVTVALDESLRYFDDPLHLREFERRYAERLVRTRLHQPMFRARVLRAYASACAICNLKHAELLDAAHIIPDGEGSGVAEVSNGLALCKLHHASYDRNLLGITPDYEVRINQRLLDEVDGPMLRHGLQDMHKRALTLPRRPADHPSKSKLAERFTLFAA